MIDQLSDYLATTRGVLLALTVALLLIGYFKVKRAQSYWKREGIKYIEPSFFFGNLQVFGKTKSLTELSRDFYQKYPEERYYGFYQFLQPTLLIRDPKLIKQIAVKFFDNFTDHRRFVDPENDPLFCRNLFASEGERWRDLRSTLSPSFTSSKMKTMFVLMDEVTQRFLTYLKDQKQPTLELEVKDAFSRYSNDVIASTVFGFKVDSMRDKDNEFYRMGKETNFLGVIRLISTFMFAISPGLSKFMGASMVPKHIADYFRTIMNDALRIREEQKIVRPDLIHLLTEARNTRLKAAAEEEAQPKVNEGFSSTIDDHSLIKSTRKLEISNEDIFANCFLFFFAGFETVSTFLTFILYELAVNPGIQDRLRKEINAVWEAGGSEINYESLLGMNYLDMVVSESLRKWPPLAFTDRSVTKDFTIQPEKPGERPLLLKKGMICWIPIYALHHDENYYPDPFKFDPERFSDENKRNIDLFTYMPFGVGPRNCIGSRFGLLEGKLILFRILREFELVPVKKTVIPVVIDKNDINLRAEGGVWIGFKRLF